MHACASTAKYTLQLEHYHTAEACYFTSKELYKQIVKTGRDGRLTQTPESCLFNKLKWIPVMCHMLT